MTVAVSVTEAIGWTLLALLLLATFAAAAVFDRQEWPSLVGDEATYLLAAASLARDGDLRYEISEVDRFRREWRRYPASPDGLILQSPDGGKRLYYAKPALYPAAIAPFLLAAGRRGPFLANGLFLAALGVLLAWGLKPALAAAAPWWAGAFLFVSVLPAYTFWAHPDLFFATLAVAGLALVFGPPSSAHRQAARFAAAGGLLALVAIGRPWYVGLLLAAAAALALEHRAWGPPRRLALGAMTAIVVVAGGEALARGQWSPYAGERVSFSAATGFPKGDGSPSELALWERRVSEEGPGSWTAPGRRFPFPLTSELWGWNALYFLLGRDVGLLPYFPSLLLGFVGARRGSGRGWLVLAFAVAAAGFVASRPFNFYGGGGAIANRYIVPVLPALWFLCARRRSPMWAPAMALAAAPLLLPLWTAPRAFPFPPGEGYPWVSAAARRWLPYETTQSHLKPAGREDFVHRGLWIKPLSPGIAPDTEPNTEPDTDRLLIGRRAETALEFLAGRATPIGATLCYRTEPGPGAVRLHYQGRESEPDDAAPGAFRLALGGPSARHPMWWTDDRWSLYRIEARSEPRAAAANGWLALDPDCSLR